MLFRSVRAVLLTFACLYLAVLAYFKVQLVPNKPAVFAVPAHAAERERFAEREPSEPLQSIPFPSPVVASPRVDAVKEAIAHAFDGYAKHAWGFDELMPVSRRGKNAFCQSGATIIDSLSTLWIAKLGDRFDKGREWALATDFSKLHGCNQIGRAHV